MLRSAPQVPGLVFHQLQIYMVANNAVSSKIIILIILMIGMFLQENTFSLIDYIVMYALSIVNHIFRPNTYTDAFIVHLCLFFVCVVLCLKKPIIT